MKTLIMLLLVLGFLIAGTIPVLQDVRQTTEKDDFLKKDVSNGGGSSTNGGGCGSGGGAAPG